MAHAHRVHGGWPFGVGLLSRSLNIHVPKTADIVFVEYNQNDPQQSNPLFGSAQRKCVPSCRVAASALFLSVGAVVCPPVPGSPRAPPSLAAAQAL